MGDSKPVDKGNGDSKEMRAGGNNPVARGSTVLYCTGDRRVVCVCICVYVCVRAELSGQVHHVRPRGQIPTQEANHMRRGRATLWLCGDSRVQ